MKRVWRLGIVAIFAAIGTGIAQTQTNNVPGIISDKVLYLFQHILPPERYQDLFGQEYNSENQHEEMDMAIECEPSGTTYEHEDISLDWLVFGGSGSISGNAASGLDVCAMGPSNIQFGSDLHASLQGDAEMDFEGRMDWQVNEAFTLHVGDQPLIGLFGTGYDSENEESQQISFMHSILEMTPFSVLAAGCLSDPPGITFLGYDPVDFSVDTALALWPGLSVPGEGEGETDPVAELAVVEMIDEEEYSEAAYVRLQGKGDAATAMLANKKASLTVDAAGNVVVQLGEESK